MPLKMREYKYSFPLLLLSRPLCFLTLLPYDIEPAVNKDLPALTLVAQAAVEGTQAAVSRVVQLGVKTADMFSSMPGFQR